MITPSANLLPYLTAADSTPIWYVKITKSEGLVDPDAADSYWPFVSGSGGGFQYRIFSTGTLTWTNRATLLADYVLHEDRLAAESIRDVVFKLSGADQGIGGLSATDSFEIRIDNTDGALAGRLMSAAFKGNPGADMVDVNFAGRKIELFLTFDGLTAEADSLLRFTGTVDDAYVQGDELVVRALSKIQAYDALVPPRLFENTVEGFTKGADGQAIPLVFGSVAHAPGYLTKYVSDTGSADTGPVVKFADVDELAIDGITLMVYGAQGLAEAGGYATFCVGTRTNLSFYTPLTYKVSEGEMAFTNPDIEAMELEVECKPDGYAGNFAATYQTAADPDNVLDDDDATYSRVYFAVPTGYHVLALKLPTLSVGGQVHRDEATGYTGVFVRVNMDVQLATGANGRLRIYFPSEKDGWLTFDDYLQCDEIDYNDNGTINVMGGEGLQMHEGATVTWAEFSSLAALTAKFLKFQAFDQYVDVFNLRVAIGFTLDLQTEGYFATMTGYKDETPSVVTGTSGLLIENPAHILAALYVYWGKDVTVGNTRLADLRALAAGARDGWIFARSLYEQKKLSAYVAELGEQAAMWVHLDNQGRIMATPWEVIDGEDPVLSLVPGDCLAGELDNYGQSRTSAIKTSIQVKYGFSKVRDEYDGLVYCNTADSSPEMGAAWESLCAWAKHDSGGFEDDLVVECPWIEDRDTAVELLQRLVRFHASRRWWIQWTCDLAAVALLVGDRIDFSPAAVDAWPVNYPPQMLAANYRIIEMRVRPGTDRVTVKASEVYQ